ncbi:MAG: hypothetical protein KHY31_07050, partial [Clostridiales bacterium]|nr:hypothetical protein [Clostridiales bacterium]
RIHAIKSSEKIGVKYMQAWEEKILEQEKAREEGRKEGLAAGLSQGHASGLREGLTQGGIQKLRKQVEKKVQKGFSVKEIAEMLEEDIETIQKLIEEL